MAYSKKPRALNSILRDFMKKIPRHKELNRGMILHLWPEVVGTRVAKATRDLHFERGNLIVKVESEAWRHELHMSRFSIRKKLNEKVGNETVTEIIIRC